MITIPKLSDLSGVVDIEAEQWDRFVCGAIHSPRDGTGTEIYWWDQCGETGERGLWGALWLRGGTWAAHHGGRYDFLWWLDLAESVGCRVDLLVAGSRIVALRAGDLTLWDSGALWPMSLRSLGRAFPRPGWSALGGGKMPLDLPCRCGIGCGGYCSIRRGMVRRDRALLSTYLESDVLTLWHGLQGLGEWCEAHRIDPGLTIGSTSWRTLDLDVELPRAEWRRDADHDLARRACYGGRAEVFRLAAPTATRWDRRSAYPSELARAEVPIGDYEVRSGPMASAAYRADRPGVYVASVDVPECHVGPLPARVALPNGRSRLAYPWGRLRGAWALPELRAAEGLGVRVVGVEKAIVWGETCSPFGGTVRRLYAIRDALPDGDPRREWIKLVLNGLVGKLWQDRTFTTCKIDPDQSAVCPRRGVQPEACLFGGHGKNCCAHRCVGACNKWRAVGPPSRPRAWVKDVYRIGKTAHVGAAAYVLAGVRVDLTRELASAGPRAVYSDTDGIVSLDGWAPSRVGDALGDWRREGRIYEWRARAPKDYTYTDGETGEVIGRVKGISSAAADWDRALDGIDLGGVESFLTSAKRDRFFRARTQVRRAREPGTWCGSRLVDPSDGSTVAPHYPSDF